MINDKMTSSIYDTAVKHRELQIEIQKIFQTVVDGLNFCTLAHKVKYTAALDSPIQDSGRFSYAVQRGNIFRRAPREEGTPIDASTFLWALDDILSDVNRDEKIAAADEIRSNTDSMRTTRAFYDSWPFGYDFEISDMLITDESIYRHRPELRGTAMLRFVDPRMGESTPMFRFIMSHTDRFLEYDECVKCWVFREPTITADLDAWISSFAIMRLADAAKIRIPLHIITKQIERIDEFADFPTIFATVEHHGENPLGMKSIGMDDVLKSLIAPESVAIIDEIQRQLDIHDEFRKLRSKLKSGKML